MEQLSVIAIRDRIASGLVSAREVVEDSIAAIRDLNPQFNSFTFVDEIGARARATALDGMRTHKSDIGPLHGVPMGIKDCMDVKGLPTTCGVPAWRHNVASTTCESVKLLEEGGAILIGKTNLNECALGVTTVNRAFGASRNPWDASRIPGGSSGGSASAVAAGMVAFTLGTDTGGSIRIPASLCGVSGLRPTTGLVSSDGVWPLASSFDSVGPIARSADDISTVLNVLNMPGSRSTNEGPNPFQQVNLGFIPIDGLTKMTIGMQDAYTRALSRLEQSGIHLVEVSIPSWTEIERVFSTLARYEISRRHRSRGAFSPDVVEIMQDGDSVTDAAYAQALEVRSNLWWSRVKLVLEGYDALVLPSTGHEAVRLGVRSIIWSDGEDEPLMNALSRFSYMASLFGLPAISVPMGFVNELPVGMQIVGSQNEDSSLLSISRRVEAALAEREGIHH